MEFLRQNLDNGDNLIWLIIPGGLISGILVSFDAEERTIVLDDAVYYSGTVERNISYATIQLNQIIGWGLGNPNPIFVEQEDE